MTVGLAGDASVSGMTVESGLASWQSLPWFDRCPSGLDYTFWAAIAGALAVAFLN
jgi:hypothetical protein